MPSHLCNTDLFVSPFWRDLSIEPRCAPAQDSKPGLSPRVLETAEIAGHHEHRSLGPPSARVSPAPPAAPPGARARTGAPPKPAPPVPRSEPSGTDGSGRLHLWEALAKHGCNSTLTRPGWYASKFHEARRDRPSPMGRPGHLKLRSEAVPRSAGCEKSASPDPWGARWATGGSTRFRRRGRHGRATSAAFLPADQERPRPSSRVRSRCRRPHGAVLPRRSRAVASLSAFLARLQFQSSSREKPSTGASAWSSVRLVNDLGDQSGNCRLLQPALQPFWILLGQDVLADGIRNHDAADPKHGQQVARCLLGATWASPLVSPRRRTFSRNHSDIRSPSSSPPAPGELPCSRNCIRRHCENAGARGGGRSGHLPGKRGKRPGALGSTPPG